jgi:hypothetical protein
MPLSRCRRRRRRRRRRFFVSFTFTRGLHCTPRKCASRGAIENESVDFDIRPTRGVSACRARRDPRVPVSFAPRFATARSNRHSARAYLPPLRRDRGPVPEIPRRLFVQVPFPGEKSLQAMHVSAVGPAPEVAGKVARVAVAGRHPRSILGELRVRARDRKGGRRRAAARAIVDLMTRVTRQAVMTRQRRTSKYAGRVKKAVPTNQIADVSLPVSRRRAGIASRWR